MKKVICILLIIIGLGTGGFLFFKDKITSTISNQIIDSTIKDIANEYGISDDKVNEVLNNVSSEDKETVKEIIENNVDIKTAAELATSDNKEEAIEYVKENLSNEDQDKLEDLYNKYAELLE